ncbi:MAG: DUF5677 domain-containing protein [Candidatus Udaeobacter sp.]
MPTEDPDQVIEEILKQIISESNTRPADDLVAKALLFLLVRVANSWRSIRTLRKYTPDKDGFMIDAGTIIRAMYDAYFQAEFVLCDRERSMQRAKDYFEFEHVEKYKLFERILAHSNWIAERLKLSPKREAGQNENKRQFERVKDRFPLGKKQKDKTRSHWYPGNLTTVATDIGKTDEYDTMLALFNGSVHSSAFAVNLGPPISAEHVLNMASTIVAKTARLGVVHNAIKLGEIHQQILDLLCSPPGARNL